MPDQKISQLTAIVTVDNSTDVLPIVDISANTTKKVTPTQLKTSLALDNVNNTSDANKPVSIAQQDALNAKVSSNAAITAGTAPKITFDAKGLVTAGNTLDETDLPTGINANKIGTGVVSTTEFEYLNGVTSAIQTQLNAKQATLVSGTNIKTINSTSLLGSGDITISASPSGVVGAIQFSNGSAFASDAANLFWDDTNNYLGIGTNTPSVALEVQNNARIRGGLNLNGSLSNSSTGIVDINGLTYVNAINGFVGVGVSTPSARLHARGSGSTSATTSLLVQNSSAFISLKTLDNGEVLMYPSTTYTSDTSFRSYQSGGLAVVGLISDRITISGGGAQDTYIQGYGTYMHYEQNRGIVINKNASAALSTTPSALVEMQSTTQGFLPPRMTTTQKNAIASPAAGLVVYDSTTNKLCCYNGSTWNDLF